MRDYEIIDFIYSIILFSYNTPLSPVLTSGKKARSQLKDFSLTSFSMHYVCSA
jgi:hypothetical protein